MSLKLKLFNSYSRKDVHDIFDPKSPFTPQAGTWGLHGIVKIPKTAKDYVFFVTYGQQQGNHIFDESITEDGVLSWQSQPAQSFDSPDIKNFINHDSAKNNIYLFLRNGSKDGNVAKKYTYLGKLAYLNHDKDRIKPVHFQWQLMDFDNEKINTIERTVGIRLIKNMHRKTLTNALPNTLTLSTMPKGKPEAGVDTKTFQARKAPDYEKLDNNNRALGLKGEMLVLAIEKENLKALGHDKLVEKVQHVSVDLGDGAGYDILSYNADESPKYIEVKTTTGPASTAFYMSKNELDFLEQNRDTSFIYRIYEYIDESNSGKYFIIPGNELSKLKFKPIQYSVSIV